MDCVIAGSPHGGGRSRVSSICDRICLSPTPSSPPAGVLTGVSTATGRLGPRALATPMRATPTTRRTFSASLTVIRAPAISSSSFLCTHVTAIAISSRIRTTRVAQAALMLPPRPPNFAAMLRVGSGSHELILAMTRPPEEASSAGESSTVITSSLGKAAGRGGMTAKRKALS